MNLKLCFFRHGRTYWNAEGRYQGLADIDLDELGWRQGHAVARRTVEMKPVAIYSSPLKRCMDVAKLCSEVTGIDVVSDSLLVERDVGSWSGKVRSEVNAEFPEDLAAWMGGDENVRPGGGESITDVLDRVQQFMDTVTQNHEDGTVVVMSHGAYIRHVIHWVFGKDFHRNAIGVPSQASLTVINVRDSGFSVEAYNDRGHLLETENIDKMAPAPKIY